MTICSAGGMLANMAVLLRGKTVVNLNYTANLTALGAAVSQADIQTVYTSRRFVKKLQGRGIDIDVDRNKLQAQKSAPVHVTKRWHD